MSNFRELAAELLLQAKQEEMLEKANREATEAAIRLAAIKNALVEQGFQESDAIDLIKIVIGLGGRR